MFKFETTSVEDFYDDFKRTLYNNDESGSIPYEVSENDESYFILAELPGFAKNNVDISVENRILKISAKRDSTKGKIISSSSWVDNKSISYKLGILVDEKDVLAELKDGILKVSIPKSKISLKKIMVS